MERPCEVDSQSTPWVEMGGGGGSLFSIWTICQLLLSDLLWLTCAEAVWGGQVRNAYITGSGLFILKLMELPNPNKSIRTTSIIQDFQWQKIKLDQIKDNTAISMHS
ncbi:hypothetical protein QJS10_CPA09g00516 [Acorus calamus]|uniref:Uncharacterized protein n=1 Tax=Acorus calamus TaxID=4465 RepID=A0AAV9E4Z7_ACOCL|nr:hypothetical protein QJS10_CPA09g00516 [Acorus calamus]